jgi:hypothetical protein
LQGKVKAGDRKAEAQMGEIHKERNIVSHNSFAFSRYSKLLQEEMKRRGLSD